MKKLCIGSLIVCLTTACTLWPKASQVDISAFDLGVQSASADRHSAKKMQKLHKSVLVTDATAPSWLDTTAIYYRLLYHNPTQAFTYANSRWIATPAALLTHLVRNRIAADTSEQVVKDYAMAKTDYVLHIELEEFTQLFDTIDSSRIVIGFRTSLIERNTRKLLAQKDFKRIEKTSSADAPGAVSALSTASNELIDELVDWMNAAIFAQ